MYWQDEYIREDVSLTLNDTYKLDLPETGILGSLLLRVYAQFATGNPTAGLNTWRLVDWLDNVSIILNGATVCKSLSGKQAQFLSFLDQKVVSPTKWLEYSQPYQREHILLNFGRFFGDKDMGLDLEKFDSVELQFKNSGTSTYFQSIALSVMAHWMREPAGVPVGYMRSEEWRKWTTVAGETKYLDLPTEYVLRRIALQAIPAVDSTTKVSKTALWNLMEDIELSFKTGVLRVYKGGVDELLWLNALDMGVLPITGGWTYHTADRGFDTGIGYVDAIALAAGTKTGAAATVIPTIEGDNLNNTQKPEAQTSDELVGFLARGVGYHNCVYFRFDQDPSPFSWLDPEARKTVQLNIKTRDSSSAADGTNAVVLDRLVRY